MTGELAELRAEVARLRQSLECAELARDDFAEIVSRLWSAMHRAA